VRADAGVLALRERERCQADLERAVEVAERVPHPRQAIAEVDAHGGIDFVAGGGQRRRQSLVGFAQARIPVQRAADAGVQVDQRRLAVRRHRILHGRAQRQRLVYRQAIGHGGADEARRLAELGAGQQPLAIAAQGLRQPARRLHRLRQLAGIDLHRDPRAGVQQPLALGRGEPIGLVDRGAGVGVAIGTAQAARRLTPRQHRRRAR
jgi:hypothetical protein